MALSASFLDELRARTVLSALVGRSVKLAKAGREMKGCCPFHNEKTPSFHVNDEKAMYHCFGCGAHGDAIRWLTDHDNLPFMDAVRTLAQAAGMEMPARDEQAAAREADNDRLRDLMALATDYYVQHLETAGVAREYLAARGVADDVISAFKLGYAPRGNDLLERANRAGYTGNECIDAGLMRADNHSTWFYARLMIPIRDARGRVIAFAGRVLDEQKPKYLNSPEGPLFAKGRTQFNLDRAAPAARAKRRLIIVEGQMDAIMMDAAGFTETVAPMGTAITDAHLERAWRVHIEPILLLDGDAAGHTAAVRACEKALVHAGPACRLKVAKCPQGSDPDSLLRADGADAVEAVLSAAQPLVDFMFDAVVAG